MADEIPMTVMWQGKLIPEMTAEELREALVSACGMLHSQQRAMAATHRFYRACREARANG